MGKKPLFSRHEYKKIRRRDIAIVLSIVIHLVMMNVSFEQAPTSLPRAQKKIVKVRLKPASDLKKKDVKQIVNNENRGREEKPVDSKFLSEKNQTYDRQTTAKRIASFNKAAKGIQNGKKNAKQSQNIVAQKKIPKKSKKQHRSRKKGKKKITFADLGVKQSLKPRKQRAPSVAKLGLKTGDINSKGLAANNDFIEDVPLGDFTQLNTQEFKYYGFYHRIRQKLEQFWGKSLRNKAEKLYKSGKRLPATENLITSLKIVLDHKGQIVDVLIQGSSGVNELDDAAIEAFNKAGPFPNPPSDMIRNGQAVIEWGFVVKS